MSARITAATAVYGVIGDPVGHSLSPLMHNAWIAAAGLDAVYVALPVPAGADLSGLRKLGLKGINVTIPHKEQAAALADLRVGAAERLGVANVLAFGPEGVTAHNTDVGGFLASLDEAKPGWERRTRTALVIGAGGAARAIAWGLAERGVTPLIANRTPERAVALAAVIPNAAAAPWVRLAEAFAMADLIVNATPLGLSGGEDRATWPFEHARADALAVDAVYRPLRTRFLQAAAAHDLIAVDGLGMLLHQGALAFDIWFGVTPDLAVARTLLERALAAESEA